MTSQPFTPTIPPPAGSRRARPTVRELPADLLTPVGAFLRIRDRGPGFLLESVERGQQVGRYSFLAAGCEPLELDARRAASRRCASASRATATPTCDGPAAVLRRRRRLPRLRRRSAASSRPCRCPPAREGDDDGAGALPARAGRRRVRPRAPDASRWSPSPGYGRDADEIAPTCSARCPPASSRCRPLSGAGASYAERTPGDYEAMVRAAQEHIERRRRRSRSCPRSAIARPTAAHARSRSTARCAPSTRRRTWCSATSATARSSRASPETHVSLDARRHRRRCKPIAGTRRRDADGAADDALAARAGGATRRSAPST